jgi:hypothetical protein
MELASKGNKKPRRSGAGVAGLVLDPVKSQGETAKAANGLVQFHYAVHPDIGAEGILRHYLAGRVIDVLLQVPDTCNDVEDPIFESRVGFHRHVLV